MVSEGEPSVGLLRNGNRRGDFRTAARCGAKTRRGTTCQCPAMANGRCRMHGGTSTGPRTSEGLERSRRANWKHGGYSATALEQGREFRKLLRQMRMDHIQLKREIITRGVF